MKAIKNIRICLLTVMLMISAAARANSYYSSGTAIAVPSAGGKVWAYADKNKSGDNTAYSGPGTDSCYQKTYHSGLSEDDITYTYSCEDSVGYHFDKWYTDRACSSQKDEKRSFTEKIKDKTDIKNASYKYYAHFIANTYTITLDNESLTSTGSTSVSLTYDSNSHAAITNPTKTDYTFRGWYSGNDGTGDLIIAEDGTLQENIDGYTGDGGIWRRAKDTTLYAKWAPNYKVAFDKNGGQGDNMANQSFYYGEAAKALSTNTYTRAYTVAYTASDGATCSTSPANTASSYTFDGWATTADGSKAYADGAEVSDLTSTAGATVTLFARWINGGVTLPTATKKDSVLEGWYSNSARTSTYWIGAAGATYYPTADIRLYAKWIKKHTPVFTGPVYVGDYYEMDVDDTYSGFTFTHVSDSVAVITGEEGVISYDKATNTLTANKAGTATIKFTQIENDTLLGGTSDIWSIRVSLVTNNLVLNSSSDTKFVGQEVTNVRDLESQNSNATVQTSSSAPGIAHYDVANNKIVIDNAGDSLFVSKSVTITIWQAATAKYAASGNKTFTLTVNKYSPLFSGSNYNGLKVDDEQTADYTYTNVSADAPTNDDDDDFYYTIENVSFDSLELNKKYNSLDSLVRFDPATKKITALNAGECDIVFHQKETRSIYSGTSASYHITVGKWDNTLYANSSASYSVSTYVDRTLDSIQLTATNTDYANCPISVTPTKATNDTVSYGYNASTRKVGISTHHYLTTATWAIHQDENYKYEEADGSFSVNVIRETEAKNCYVLDDATGANWGTGGEKNYELTEAGYKLTFEIQRTAILGVSSNRSWYVRYSADGKNWKSKDLSAPSTDNWYPDSVMIDADTRYIKFISEAGASIDDGFKATGNHAVRNVKVTRRTWTQASTDTLRITKTAGNNLVYPNDVAGAGSFDVQYSIANGGDLTIVNDNSSKFTLSHTSIEGENCSADTVGINVTYNPTREGNDTAHLVVYNRVYRDTIVVIGTCVKRNQSGKWKEKMGILTTGTKVGNPYSSTRSLENEVTYRSSNSTYVEVNLTGDTILAKAPGTARLYVTVAGDDNYYAKEDSIDITVTDKKVQYIEWGDGMEKKLRRLHVGDSRVLLEAKAMSNIDTCSTNGKRAITFTSRNTSIVDVTTEGGKSYLTITSVKANAGETWIVASQAGGDDGYHDYIPVSDSLRVIVRDPDAICPVKYVYNFNDSTHLVDGKEDGIRTNPVDDGYVGTIVMERSNGSKTKTRLTCTFAPAHTYAIWYAKKDKDNSAGSITIEQYIPAESRWVTAKNVTSFVTGVWTRDSVALDPRATQVRGILTQSTKYIYFGGLQVKMVPYAAIDEGGAEKDTLVFSSFIGTPQVKELSLRWYARKDMHLILPEGSPFKLSDEVLGQVCENDTTPLTITYETMVGQTHRYYPLVFSDNVEGGFRDTVILDASATAEEITFKDGSWSNTVNKYKVANVAAGESLTISTEVAMYSLSIATGATVTVTAEGGLSVGAGGITNASSNKIKLESNTDGMTGYIRVSPDYKGVMPEADVELFTQAYYNRNEKDSEKRMAKMQYIGVPVDKENYAATSLFSSKTYVYSWSESEGNWVNNKRSLKVAPFAGYSITQYDVENGGEEIEFSGKLVAPRDTTIELAYSGSDYSGRNFLANSYAAPIDISRFSYSDFSLEDEEDTSVDYAIYLFNTGAKGEYKDGVESPASLTAAGQYITVSPGTVTRLKGLDPNYPIVIPAMQGFFVKTNAAGKSLTLNYSRLVWNADYEKHGNEKMRVQRRAAEEGQEETDEELGGAMKISLYSSRAVDHIYLLESEDYSKSFENGYDGRKMLAGELNIYAIEGEEALAIDATDDLEGTKLGIRTGLDDADTIVFSRVQNVENLYLHDRYTGIYTLIEEGATYGFYADPDSYLDDRFEIIGFGSQGSATGVGNEKVDNNATKYIKDNTLFILKNGIKYNSLGQKVQ